MDTTIFFFLERERNEEKIGFERKREKEIFQGKLILRKRKGVILYTSFD